MCTSPLPARRVGGQIEFLGRSEKERFFSNKAATLQIPCGVCPECKLKRSREWAIRCMHEASMHEDNVFLTLTYRDSPDNYYKAISLDYTDFMLFMKRLRFAFPGKEISYLVCGEYGETNPVTKVIDGGKYRAHFHAILFGLDFPDKRPIKLLNGGDYHKSALLDALWRRGDCLIGKVTFESSAYVARYAMKKINGDMAKAVYTVITPDGECIERVPEFLHASKRPAVGKRWFERYGRGAFAHDRVVMRGHEAQPPRYYDKLLPRVVRQMVVDNRVAARVGSEADHTDERNNVRDVVVRAGLSQVNRR